MALPCCGLACYAIIIIIITAAAVVVFVVVVVVVTTTIVTLTFIDIVVISTTFVFLVPAFVSAPIRITTTRGTFVAVPPLPPLCPSLKLFLSVLQQRYGVCIVAEIVL